jgi:hypothetical protein
MTQDEIIDMAIQAGASPDEKIWLMYPEELVVFAKMVVAKEREACAKVCEQEQEYWGWDKVFDSAKLIRARGEA